MPRPRKDAPKSAGPALTLHRPSGQARVRILGRDYYCGPWGSDEAQAEYERLVGEYLTTKAQPRSQRDLRPARTTAPARGITVGELVVLFAEAKQAGEGRTFDSSLRVPLRRFRRAFGDRPVVEFGPVDLAGWLEVLAATKDKHDRLLSRRYVNRHARVVRQCFKWGVRRGHVPGSTWEALRAVDGLRQGEGGAKELPPVRPVDDATVEATLPHLTRVVADMVRVQRRSGMRPGELCAMTWSEIDTAGDVWLYQPRKHKTAHRGMMRTIPLGPVCQQILMRYRNRAPEAAIFSPAESEAERRELVHSRRRTPMNQGNRPGSRRKAEPKIKPGAFYTTGTYRQAIGYGCDQAFPAPERTDGDALKAWRESHRWNPNQLRHAAATETRRQFGLDAAKAVLGHRQTSTTEIYAELDLSSAVEVARKLG